MRQDFKGIDAMARTRKRFHLREISPNLAMMSDSLLKIPVKPNHIANDPLASAEWDRICAKLRAQSHILEVGQDPIAWAAGLYSSLAQIDALLTVQGRSDDNAPMWTDQAHMVRMYLDVLGELDIEAGPLVRIRPVQTSAPQS